VTQDPSADPLAGLDAISRESRTALATLRGYVEIVQEDLEDRGISMPDEFQHLEGALADLLASIGRLEEHANAAGRAASIDMLTGLPNRRHLFEVGGAWMRAGGELVALLLDLDDFKWVNDAHGHHVGDAVLVEFANRVRSALRTSDLLCRLAGDEFVILLPGATLDVADTIATRIHERVESDPIEVDGVRLLLATSLGIAARSSEHDTLEDLLRSADRAMYATKRARYDERSVRRLRAVLDS
jgi:diguanylate cyclase (GGDEF)-like protein